MCNYVTENCTHYQEFGIDQIKQNTRIGLIRVNRPIQFGPMMKPICLPYGRNYIPEPQIGKVMISLGYRPRWTKCFRNVIIERSSYGFIQFSVRAKACYGRSDIFLMYQFAPQRMVLHTWLDHKHDDNYISFFQGDWLDNTMRL